MTTKPSGKRVERDARLRWVPLASLRINPLAQRDLNQARVDKLATEMDLEQLGNPTVNLRDEWFYVIDGQHRVEAVKKWLGDWEAQQIQCWTYEGLTAEEEAEKFLKLNDILAVKAFAKFRIAVQAGRPEETDIDRIVRANGLRISQDRTGGAIAAVAALRRVYARADGAILGRTLRIVRDAYGDAGLDASVLDGIGLLCHRYNGEMDDDKLVTRLKSARGGVNGLLNKAEQGRQTTGLAKAHCIAAAAVEINNAGRGGKKLPSWWKTDPTAAKYADA